MLYPLKFVPIFKEKVWGGKKLKNILNKNTESDNVGESWELSGLEGDESVAAEGFLKGKTLSEIILEYKEKLTGKRIFDKFGTKFPLLIKFIDAADDLSVQVHPDDDYAKKQGFENGKNEFWYILDADENSEIIFGVKDKISKENFEESLKENKIENVLNNIKVEKGDMFYIPAGKIHAIKKGILLAEIQQSSDITYRLYDRNRKGLDGKLRELHITEALDVADLEAEKNEKEKCKNFLNIPENCVSNKYFTVNKLVFDKKNTKNYSDIDSFKIIIGISGNFDIFYGNNEKTKVNFGETVLIPAEIGNIDIVPYGKCEILEVYIE